MLEAQGDGLPQRRHACKAKKHWLFGRSEWVILHLTKFLLLIFYLLYLSYSPPLKKQAVFAGTPPIFYTCFVHHYSNPPRFPWAGTAWPHISRGVFLSCIPHRRGALPQRCGKAPFCFLCLFPSSPAGHHPLMPFPAARSTNPCSSWISPRPKCLAPLPHKTVDRLIKICLRKLQQLLYHTGHISVPIIDNGELTGNGRLEGLSGYRIAPELESPLDAFPRRAHGCCQAVPQPALPVVSAPLANHMAAGS